MGALPDVDMQKGRAVVYYHRFAVSCVLYLLFLPSLRDINLECAEGSESLEPDR